MDNNIHVGLAGRMALLTASVLLLSLAATGCGEKVEAPKESENVAIFYIAGYNSLHGWLSDDIMDLEGGYLPTDKNGSDVVLLYSRIAPDNSFMTGGTSALVRLYMSRKKNSDGTYPVVRDTLLKFDATRTACSEETLGEVLAYAKANFPSKRYGLLFSSHGRGWVPSGYYLNPTPPISFAPPRYGSNTPGFTLPAGTHLYYSEEYGEGEIVTKSLGEDVEDVKGVKVSHEFEIEDFAAAIPYKMDYILIDACLMGGVELAYSLRGKTSLVGFSQAEVLADGFDYAKIVSQLCTGTEPRPIEVCRDYYAMYEEKGGDEHSATISAVYCDKLTSLATVCKTLFEKYRTQIAALGVDSVQGYSGGNKKWFFDLEDILLKAGITDDEKEQLSAAFSECIAFKGCTGQYYTMTERRPVPVEHFCGLSMFLPSAGNEYLDKYYKALAWNLDTELLK